MKKIASLFNHLALYLLIISGLACSSKKDKKIFTEQNVVTAWAEMALYVAKNTPANSPTFASRGFAYIGLTMYESVVHGYPEHKSLVGQLNGLDELPLPESSGGYNWVLSLNAGQAYILKNIYIQTSEANKLRIDSLEDVIFKQFSAEDNDR